jgi:hypothetical protein
MANPGRARGRGRVCDIALRLLIVAALAALVLLAALSGLLALLSGLVLLTALLPALLPAALTGLLGLLSRLVLLSALVGILIHDVSCGCTPGGATDGPSRRSTFRGLHADLFGFPRLLTRLLN